MIKAIIFDYGGVVASDVDQLIYQDIAKACQLEFEVVQKTINQLLEKYQTGKINDQGFWKKFVKISGAILPQNYQDLWVRQDAQEVKRNSEVLTLIKNLKTKGYTVAVLSNTIPPHAEFNKKNKNFDIFNQVVLSNEVGLKKPDKRIYLLVLKKLGLGPKECVYIDDVKKYLEPARRLGMQIIHYHKPSQLKNALRKIGVDF